MSTPTYTWTDIVNKLLEGLQSFLYEVGNFIATNASAIASAVLGIGLAVGIGTAVVRFVRPLVGRVVRFF